MMPPESNLHNIKMANEYLRGNYNPHTQQFAKILSLQRPNGKRVFVECTQSQYGLLAKRSEIIFKQFMEVTKEYSGIINAESKIVSVRKTI